MGPSQPTTPAARHQHMDRAHKGPVYYRAMDAAGAVIRTPPSPELDFQQHRYPPLALHYKPAKGARPPTPPCQDQDVGHEFKDLYHWYAQDQQHASPKPKLYQVQPSYMPPPRIYGTPHDHYAHGNPQAEASRPRLHPSASLLHSSPQQSDGQLSPAPTTPPIQHWPTHNLKIDEKTRKKQEECLQECERGRTKSRDGLTLPDAASPESISTPAESRKRRRVSDISPPRPAPPVPPGHSIHENRYQSPYRPVPAYQGARGPVAGHQSPYDPVSGYRLVPIVPQQPHVPNAFVRHPPYIRVPGQWPGEHPLRPILHPSLYPAFHPPFHPSFHPSLHHPYHPSLQPSLHPSYRPSPYPSFRLPPHPYFQPSLHTSSKPSKPSFPPPPPPRQNKVQPPPNPPKLHNAHQTITKRYEDYRWPVKLYELDSASDTKFEFAETYVEDWLKENVYSSEGHKWYAHVTAGFIKDGNRFSILVLHNAANPFEWGPPVETTTSIGVYGRFAHTHDEIHWTTITPSIPDLFKERMELSVKQKWDCDMPKASEKRFHRAYWLAANMLPLKGILNRCEAHEEPHDAVEAGEMEEEFEAGEEDLECCWSDGPASDEDCEKAWQRVLDNVDGKDMDSLGSEHIAIGGSEREYMS